MGARMGLGSRLLLLVCVEVLLLTGAHAQACQLVEPATQPFAALFTSGPSLTTATSGSVTTTTRKYCFKLSNSILGADATPNTACTSQCCNKEGAKLASIYMVASE